jgi:hypothetical protein
MRGRSFHSSASFAFYPLGLKATEAQGIVLIFYINTFAFDYCFYSYLNTKNQNNARFACSPRWPHRKFRLGLSLLKIFLGLSLLISKGHILVSELQYLPLVRPTHLFPWVMPTHKQGTYSGLRVAIITLGKGHWVAKDLALGNMGLALAQMEGFVLILLK